MDKKTVQPLVKVEEDKASSSLAKTLEKKLPTQPLISMNRALSMLKSKKAFAATVGRSLTHYLLEKRQNEIDSLEGNLNALPTQKMGHGAGQIISMWLQWSHPNHSLAKQVSILNQAIAKLDNQSIMPKEKAMTRFLASKVMLNLQGYRGTPLYYETYQNESKKIINTMSVKKRCYRKDIFTGKVFQTESVFVCAQRMLKALVPESDTELFKAFMDHFFNTFKLVTSEDYFTFLIALTHQQNDEGRFQEDLLEWFTAYKEFEQEKLDKTQTRISQGLTLFSGYQTQEWGLQAIGHLINKMSGDKDSQPLLLTGSKS